MSVKFLCCAPGCTWRAEYEQEPADDNPGGYTPFWCCPECGTEDSVHYACDTADCRERATHIKGAYRACEAHHDLKRARRGR